MIPTLRLRACRGKCWHRTTASLHTSPIRYLRPLAAPCLPPRCGSESAHLFSTQPSPEAAAHLCAHSVPPLLQPASPACQRVIHGSSTASLPSAALRATSSSPQSPSGHPALRAAAPAPHCTHPTQTCRTHQQRIFARPCNERAPSSSSSAKSLSSATRGPSAPRHCLAYLNVQAEPLQHAVFDTPALGSLLPCTRHRPEEELALGCCLFGALLVFLCVFVRLPTRWRLVLDPCFIDVASRCELRDADWDLCVRTFVKRRCCCCCCWSLYPD